MNPFEFPQSPERSFFRLKDLLITAALMVLFCLPAIAQAQAVGPTLTISTGSTSGSYYRFVREANDICKSEVNIKLEASTGGAENLERLQANNANLAVVQLDTLSLYSKQQDLSNIKILLPLFNEQLHFVTRGNLGKKEGGIMGLGGKEVVLATAADIKGRTLAAAGGSFMTAQVLNQLGLGASLIEERGGADAVIAGVISGKYDAGLLVGAAPLETITKMGDKQIQLKMLPVPAPLAEVFGKVYGQKGSLSYRAMAQGGTPIPTVAVTSALVTQNYQKGKMPQSVMALKNCIIENAPDQAATVGTHPAWRDLKPDMATAWPKYETTVQAVKTSYQAQQEPTLHAAEQAVKAATAGAKKK